MSICSWTNRLILKHLIQRTLTRTIMLGSYECRFGINTNSAISPMVTLFDRRLNAQLTRNSLYRFRSISDEVTPEVDQITYEKVCEETLDSLSDYFEELIENDSNLVSADVSYSSGVLTINFGEPHGTYVINRQSPNKQIWLSSPTSGPKRYDFIADRNLWFYKHDSQSLHELLQKEISRLIKSKVDFSRCRYSCLKSN